MTTAMLVVGTPKETIDSTKKLIMKILSTSAGDAVKIAALDVLFKSLEVKNVSINNCHFESDKFQEAEDESDN